MQRIERYGVIALVFLLVTILAVAVWGQHKNQSLLSFLKRDKSPEVAKLDVQNPGATTPSSGLGLSSPSHELAPLTQQPPSVAGSTDSLTQLTPPTGPGSNVVSFGQGTQPAPGAKPNSGFIVDAGPQLPIKGAATPPNVDVTPTPLDGGARTYKVKSGDTLTSIASHELGSTKRWKELETLNNVKSDRLSVGMVLKLPAGSASLEPQLLVKQDAKATPENVTPTTAGSTHTYNVRSGDSLSKIAAAQLGDANRFAEILALNPGLDPAKLAVGQSLHMPATAKSSATQAKPKVHPSSESSEVAKVEAPKKSRVQ